MKIISWNVNGIRACNRKSRLVNYIKEEKSDFVCLQETKITNDEQIKIKLDGYYDFWNHAKVKKGYSGTCVFATRMPLNVKYGINNKVDKEGRVITLEYDKFYLVNCYVPNSQLNLARLNYRLDWNDAFRNYIEELNNKKDTIICGDMNVAHKDIDVCEMYRGKRKVGFTPEERVCFEELLEVGLTDSFRYKNPDLEEYSWWFRNRPNEEFVGWRLDYFLVSNELKDKIISSEICTEIEGSDHCPIKLEIDVK